MVKGKGFEGDIKPVSAKPKQPGSSKKKADNPETAPIGHNDTLTDDQKRGLFLNGLVKLERLLGEAASAAASARAQRKAMKSDGFDNSEVNYALWLRKKPHDDAIDKAKIEARIARWLAHPVGHQFSLFGDEPDRTPDVDRAFELGKVAGLEGLACKPPYAPGSEQGQSWIKGHGEGQTILTKGFKPLADAPPDTKGRGMPGAKAKHEDDTPTMN